MRANKKKWCAPQLTQSTQTATALRGLLVSDDTQARARFALVYGLAGILLDGPVRDYDVQPACSMWWCTHTRRTPWPGNANYFLCIFGRPVRHGHIGEVCGARITPNLTNDACWTCLNIGRTVAWSNPEENRGKISFKCLILISKLSSWAHLFHSDGTGISLHLNSSNTDVLCWGPKYMMFYGKNAMTSAILH